MVRATPVADRGRLDKLADNAILDTPPERGFDDIVELETQICEAPTTTMVEEAALDPLEAI